jgi:hypothetical protein
MSNPEAYVREITSLKSEIKRLNGSMKTLREQCREKQDLLYKYMTKNGIEKYQGITAKSIRPRNKIPRKPEKEKRKDAISLFEEAGITDPETFYQEFKATQKYEMEQSEEEARPKEKKRPSESEYDPFLGF